MWIHPSSPQSSKPIRHWELRADHRCGLLKVRPMLISDGPGTSKTLLALEFSFATGLWSMESPESMFLLRRRLERGQECGASSPWFEGFPLWSGEQGNHCLDASWCGGCLYRWGDSHKPRWPRTGEKDPRSVLEIEGLSDNRTILQLKMRPSASCT